jgi:hypothetical protein
MGRGFGNKNKCLIGRGCLKYLMRKGMARVIQNKYLHSKRPSDSHFWKGLMRVKDEFSKGSLQVGNGEQTRFWENTWLGNLH